MNDDRASDGMNMCDGSVAQAATSSPHQVRVFASLRGASRTAFTLVEMLVVMGIIGILVALLFPAIKGARTAADRADAGRTVQAIEAAMRAYQNEYGRFPLQTGSSDKQYHSADYKTLIDTLRGFDTQTNPKEIVFLDVPEKALSTDGRLQDPWNEDYRIYADFNHDNRITAGPYGNVLGRAIVIWSKGSDRDDQHETNRVDDVTSWGI